MPKAKAKKTDAMKTLEKIAGGPLTLARAIESIRTPALLIAGGADLYMPVPLVLEYASHLRDARTVVLAESGHSAYWEQPQAFNRALLDFLNRNRDRPVRGAARGRG